MAFESPTRQVADHIGYVCCLLRRHYYERKCPTGAIKVACSLTVICCELSDSVKQNTGPKGCKETLLGY